MGIEDDKSGVSDVSNGEMSVDDAMYFATADRGPANGRMGRALAALETLAAEVRRLRDTIRIMSVNEGKLHARIAELETELKEMNAIYAGLQK